MLVLVDTLKLYSCWREKMAVSVLRELPHLLSVRLALRFGMRHANGRRSLSLPSRYQPGREEKAQDLLEGSIQHVMQYAQLLWQ